MPLVFRRPFSAAVASLPLRTLDFESGSGWVDSFGGIWTPSGGTTLASVPKNGTRSVLFVTGSTLTIPNDQGQFDLTTKDFSIQFWMRRTNSGKVCGTYQWDHGYTGGWSLGIAGIGAVYLSHSGTVIQGTVVVPLNTWTHVCVERVGQVFYVYVNGTLDSSVSSSVSINNGVYWLPSVFRLNGKMTDGRAIDETWSGYLDDFKFLLGSAVHGGANFTPS